MKNTITIICIINIILLLPLGVRACCSNSVNEYYIQLAEKDLNEIIKIEKQNIIEIIDNLTISNITDEDRANLKKIIEKVENDQAIDENDISSILDIFLIIGNYESKGHICKTKYWCNPLTYSVFISCLKNNNYLFKTRLIRDLIRFSCPNTLQSFRQNLRLIKNTLNYPEYSKLLIMIENEVDRIDTTYTDIPKNIVLSYKAKLNDRLAEKKLLEFVRNAESFDEKIEAATMLGIAATDSCLIYLFKMLDDTIKLIKIPNRLDELIKGDTIERNQFYSMAKRLDDSIAPFGLNNCIIKTIRSNVFIQLSSLFCMHEIFTKELELALNQDNKESIQGRFYVNQYFKKVSKWINENYGVKLNRLNQYSFFEIGHWANLHDF